MEVNQFIKGSLTAIVLKLLEDNGRMYGYEMTRAVKERSAGKVQITEAALYPALHKLVDEGLLTTETEPADGRLRKYYSLTKKGKKQKLVELEALNGAINTLQQLLNSKLSHG